MKIGFWITESRSAQGQEAVFIPGLENIFVGIEINREIEKVRHEWNRFPILRHAAGLQHIQALYDEDVWSVDFNRLVGHHVIDEVRIDWCARRPPPGLYIRKKTQQRRQIITFRKSFLFHQAFAFKNCVRIEKSIGGDEVDLRHIRPARQQSLQDARRGRLANRYRTGDADDIRHLGILGAEETLLRAE